MTASAMTLDDSMKKLRASVRALEKLCIRKENDIKKRQQDLFVSSVPDENNNVIELDVEKITQKIDRTISQVEDLLKDEG